MMETKVLHCDANNPEPAVIAQAVEIIDSGGLVAFPTETVYGIGCRARKSNLAKLDSIKGRGAEKFYTLHISPKEEVRKYIPTMDLRGKKLVAKGWPGPITIVFDLEEKDIEIQRKRLDTEVFESLYHNNTIGIRCPANDIATQVLTKTKDAVVMPSANKSGNAPAVNAEEVVKQFPEGLDLCIDGGECEYKMSSTVVKIGKMGVEILREGLYSKAQVRKLATVQFLFVCTGNTCRSPMAEGMMRKYLAEKALCSVDHLEEKCYKIVSAGVMGIVGMPASIDAQAVCQARGIDISSHRSRGLNRELIEESDFIYVMSRSHKEQIVSMWPDAAVKCELLAKDRDILDPIGGTEQDYEDCARIIEKAIKEKFKEFGV